MQHVCVRARHTDTNELRATRSSRRLLRRRLKSQARARRVVVSAHDVTERRRLEQQLQQSQKMEAVGQLTGGVAHDFNNLLTLVIGGLDIIGRQITNLPDPLALTRMERGREMAMQGAQRAASLTTRLLAFSRQQPLNPQALDANKLVVDVCDLLRRAIGETIAVETVLGNDVWRMYADANQLENALLNIGFNARDAMPNGGKLIIETANASLDKAYTSLTERRHRAWRVRDDRNHRHRHGHGHDDAESGLLIHSLPLRRSAKAPV